MTHPHFEEVRGGVAPWLMARWKARVDFLLTVNLLPLRRYKPKRVKTHCLLEGLVSLSQDFRGRVVPR